jgi:integrase
MYRIKGRPSYYARRTVKGRDVWRSLGPDFERAKERLQRFEAELPAGDILAVGEAARRWLASHVQNNRCGLARGFADARVRVHLTPCLGDIRLDRLNGEHIAAYRTWLDKRGLKPGTVINSLNDLRCMLRWAVGAGFIGRNPFIPKHVMPKAPELVPKVLTAAQVVVLLAIPEPDAFVIRLGLGTGLRWREMCNARVEHLESDMLLVPKSKSGRARRVPVVGDMLTELRQRVGKLLPYDAEDVGARRVFVARVQRRSCVDDFGVHRLRHTFASRWVAAGRNIEALRLVLGHASLEMTQRYVRLTDDFTRAEAQREVAR